MNEKYALKSGENSKLIGYPAQLHSNNRYEKLINSMSRRFTIDVCVSVPD